MKALKKILLTAASLSILASCSSQDLAKSDDPAKASTVHLERQFQHVNRYDCNDRLYSSKIETVSSPTAWVNIRPKKSQDVYTSSFYNLTTSDGAGLITDHSKFQIDYAPGYLNMIVRSGMNKIRYRFSYCHKWSEADPETGYSTCLSSSVGEEGYTFIQIFYTEKTLEGTYEQRPTPEECSQGKKTTVKD